MIVVKSVSQGDCMNYKSTLARMTGNYRTLDKKALAMKKSWDDVEKLLGQTGKAGKKKKSSSGENKK